MASPLLARRLGRRRQWLDRFVTGVHYFTSALGWLERESERLSEFAHGSAAVVALLAMHL